MTRRPVRCPAATGYQAPQEFAGLPAPPAFPGSPPGLARLRWWETFYCQCGGSHKVFGA